MKNAQFSKKVADYFDNSLIIYLRYSKEHLHFGMWDNHTKNLDEALVNTTQFVVKCLDIQKEDIILDAGCGIGGSCRYIVSNYGVKTIGINISGEQIKKAKELSRGVNHSSFLEFSTQDFVRTNFPDAFFSKIFAIESVCHTPDKEKFLVEAYRLLKKGGKLVVVDGFQARYDLNENEKKMTLLAGRGWAVPNLSSTQGFERKLIKVGFDNIVFHDKTDAVAKTSWIVHKKGKKWYPITYVLSKFRLIPVIWHYHTISSFYHQKLIQLNICKYGVFVAEK